MAISLHGRCGREGWTLTYFSSDLIIELYPIPLADTWFATDRYRCPVHIELHCLVFSSKLSALDSATQRLKSLQIYSIPPPCHELLHGVLHRKFSAQKPEAPRTTLLSAMLLVCFESFPLDRPCNLCNMVDSGPELDQIEPSTSHIISFEYATYECRFVST